MTLYVKWHLWHKKEKMGLSCAKLRQTLAKFIDLNAKLHQVCIPLMSSCIEVVFHWFNFLLKLSSIEVIFHIFKMLNTFYIWVAGWKDKVEIMLNWALAELGKINLACKSDFNNNKKRYLCKFCFMSDSI